MLTIEQKKEIARIYKKVRELSKPSSCLICGKSQTSFCNSHLIPQMVLKSIAINGKLLQASILMDIEDIDIEKGFKIFGKFKNTVIAKHQRNIGNITVITSQHFFRFFDT